MPRAVSGGDSIAVAVIGLILLVFSPIGAVVAVAAVFLVLRQVARHWWEIGAVALVVTFAVGAVVQIATGDLIGFHLGSYVDAITGNGSWLAVLWRTAVLGIPAGITAGVAYVGASEHWSGGAEWHPMEQRRRAVEDRKAEAEVTARASDNEAAKVCSAPPLGVMRDGDLSAWIEDGFVVVPTGQFPAMGLLGESGSGKTVTAERMVSLWARAGRKVIFCDFKGSDPELAERIVAAYKHERPEAACGLWPAQPLDMWRGSPVEIANRLLQVQAFTEPYYEGVARTAVRLAVLAPDIDGRGPVNDSESFLGRLDAEFLRNAWEGRPEARDVASVTRDPKALDGVRLRYAGFFSALAGRLDHGFSFEDCDLAVLTVPTLAAADDAMAVARIVLADFGAYALSRKPRIGEDVTLIVDEFSAVTEAAPLVIDLAERVRDVGGQVVVSAQSYEGLGRDDAERRRMRDALAPGGLVVHRLAEPEEAVKPAGTVRAVEQSWQLGERGSTGLGTAKMTHKLRVDPDAVRQARTGEAWVITHGRAAHLSVLRTRIDDETRDHARRLVDAARRQGFEDLRAGVPATPQAWWEVRLTVVDNSPRAALEDEGLGELMPGPTPLALPPGPTAPTPLPPALPDPRLLLAILAYVRAGLVAQAIAIAAQTEGITDPRSYVDAAVTERAKVVAQASRGRRAS